MKPSSLFLACAILTRVSNSPAAEQPNKFKQENIVIEIPGIGPLSDKRVSWAVLRGRNLWSQGDYIDLNKIAWPTWDTTQLPFALVPANNEKISVAFLDQDKNLVLRKSIEKAWSPFEKNTELDNLKPDFFQIEIEHHKRYHVKSPIYPFPRQLDVFECELKIDTETEDGKVAKLKKLKLCIESLKGISQEDNQWYISIEWPKFSGRENISYTSQTDRELRKILKEKKHIFYSKKVSESTFVARAGRTLIEKLPSIGWRNHFPRNREYVTWSPKKDEPNLVLGSEKDSDGSEIEIWSMFGDGVEMGYFRSDPAVGIPIFVQFAPPEEKDTNNLSITITDLPESRTGAPGLLRNWNLKGSLAYQTLASNRGEPVNYFGVGTFDTEVNLSSLPLIPRLILGRDFIHAGSSLSITEMQTTISYKWSLSKYMFPYTGYMGYSLSGTNPGSSRLGSYNAIPLGFRLRLGTNQSFWQAHAATLTSLGGNGMSIGGDANLSFSRLWDQSAKQGLFWGPFINFSKYRVNLTNVIGLQETFSETRYSVGLSLGWTGEFYLFGH